MNIEMSTGTAENVLNSVSAADSINTDLKEMQCMQALPAVFHDQHTTLQ